MRFKANGNGCPAYNGEKVRYFFCLIPLDAIKFIGGKNMGWMGISGLPADDPTSSTIHHLTQDETFIEVKECHLEYLKKPTIEGEWKFRRYKKGDYFIGTGNDLAGNLIHEALFDGLEHQELSGYRWCKVKSAFGKWWDDEGGVLFHDSECKTFAEKCWNAGVDYERGDCR